MPETRSERVFSNMILVIAVCEFVNPYTYGSDSSLHEVFIPRRNHVLP